MNNRLKRERSAGFGAANGSASTGKKSPNRNKLGRQIAPGIWEDANGNPHFSLPDLLALVDLPDTLENRKRVTDMIRQMLQEQDPEVRIIERQTPSD